MQTSENKRTIEKFIDGFNKSDHEQILSCLTEDIVWDMPGLSYLEGKKAFDGEIENPAFEGRPIVRVTRMVEEDTVVAVEGSVQSKKKDGGVLHAVFCDVFEMENAKIKKLTGYIIEVKK